MRPTGGGPAFHEKALFGGGNELGLDGGRLSVFARFRSHEKAYGFWVVRGDCVTRIGGVVFEGNPFAVPVFLSCGGCEFWGKRFDMPEIRFLRGDPAHGEIAVTQ